MLIDSCKGIVNSKGMLLLVIMSLEDLHLRLCQGKYTSISVVIGVVTVSISQS